LLQTGGCHLSDPFDFAFECLSIFE